MIEISLRLLLCCNRKENQTIAIKPFRSSNFASTGLSLNYSDLLDIPFATKDII
jgi:hypothetical protein